MVSEPPAPNSSRYLPPVRTSISHAMSDTPDTDFGTHQRLNNSDSLHALNTVLGGASKVRTITSSRSPLRSTEVRYCPPPALPTFRVIRCGPLSFHSGFRPV